MQLAEMFLNVCSCVAAVSRRLTTEAIHKADRASFNTTDMKAMLQ